MKVLKMKQVTMLEPFYVMKLKEIKTNQKCYFEVKARVLSVKKIAVSVKKAKDCSKDFSQKLARDEIT